MVEELLPVLQPVVAAADLELVDVELRSGVLLVTVDRRRRRRPRGADRRQPGGVGRCSTCTSRSRATATPSRCRARAWSANCAPRATS